MGKFKNSILTFIYGLPFVSTASGSQGQIAQFDIDKAFDLDPVSLRPLNFSTDNMFAGHRSHSSHSSHSSHRSSSGGGYSAPSEPVYRSPVNTAPVSNATQTIPAPSLQPQGLASPTPQLSRADKLKLQIVRVQTALTTLGIYFGPIDGVLSMKTSAALKEFQIVKGLTASGVMDTPTLNALAVPAVP